jgi:hypothetical protein
LFVSSGPIASIGTYELIFALYFYGIYVVLKRQRVAQQDSGPCRAGNW